MGMEVSSFSPLSRSPSPSLSLSNLVAATMGGGTRRRWAEQGDNDGLERGDSDADSAGNNVGSGCRGVDDMVVVD